MEQFFKKPQYNFNMDEQKSIILTINEPATQESYSAPEHGGSSSGQGSVFSPLAPPFQSRINKDFGSMVTPPEPQVGDTAPSVEYDLLNMNQTITDSESIFENRSERSAHNNFMGSRTEAVAPGSVWPDKSSNKATDAFENFDFLLKTLSAAHAYLSMLTREQTSVLQAIRPSLLFEFLQEVAKIHQEKRMQRALSRDCAFCKNNGEPEDRYSSHALKDFKGRVLCPVLRAFSCPRCGATGDRAHTIKYCPTNDNGVDRSPSQRRRASFNSFLFSDDGSRGSFGAPGNPSQIHSSTFNESFFSSN